MTSTAPRPSNHKRNPPPPPSSTQKLKRKKSKKRSNSTDLDNAGDTPNAFARLMQYKATGRFPNGLDDPKPNTSSKKRKRGDDVVLSTTTTSTTNVTIASTDTSSQQPPQKPQKLEMLPGETISEFNRRVDAAIPISFKGLQSSSSALLKKKKKKKDEEDKDTDTDLPMDAKEDNYDFDDNGDLLPANHPKRNPIRSNPGGNNSNRKLANKRSPSPFAELKAKRPVRVGINDVVQAPPVLVVPREGLKMKGGGKGLDVPKSSGSLARREVLEQERKGVLERYRALMDGKLRG